MRGLPGLDTMFVLDTHVIRAQHILRRRELIFRGFSLFIACLTLFLVFGMGETLIWFVGRMVIYLPFMWVAARLPDRLTGWRLIGLVIWILVDTLSYTLMAVWLWYLDDRVLDLFAMAIIVTAMLSVSWVRAESALLWVCDSISIAVTVMLVPIIYYLQGGGLIETIMGFGVFALVLVYFVMANFSVWRARKETRQAQGLEVARAKRDAVGKLAGGMAHDFNNLLTVVLGNLELARLTTKPGDRAEYIAEAERSAKRGAEMIKQLLAFSRKARLETRTVDVAEIFDGVTPLISNVLGPQHRMICAPVPKGLPKIRVDTGKVQSVLLELFLNARDAMPRGGDIRLEAMETTALDIPTVSLSVQDTGEGIAADRLSLVCDPFYSTRNKATGLGLSMVRGIVEQSGGRLDITSEPGQGTCVTLHFAAATQAVGTLPSEASKLGPHRAAHRLR
ncbi:hypothetical protein GCM10022290_43660 [Sagittula marina]